MWGTSFLLTKIAVAAIQPIDLVAGRFVLGTLVLLTVLLVTRRGLPGSARLWLFIVAIALVGNCLPFLLITWGQQRIDSGLAGILMAIMPLTTVMLAHVFVAGERLNRFEAAGFLLGFLGIVVLMGPAVLLELRGSGAVLLSELAVLGGAVCYAVNTIIARRRPESDALVVTAGVSLVACLIMAPASAFTGLPDLSQVPASALIAVVILGVVSTATATVVFFKLITLAGPSFLSLINYLIPPGRFWPACCSSASARTGRRSRDWRSFFRASPLPKPRDGNSEAAARGTQSRLMSRMIGPRIVPLDPMRNRMSRASEGRVR